LGFEVHRVHANVIEWGGKYLVQRNVKQTGAKFKNSVSLSMPSVNFILTFDYTKRLILISEYHTHLNLFWHFNSFDVPDGNHDLSFIHWNI